MTALTGPLIALVFKRPDGYSRDVVNVHAAHPLAPASKLSAKTQFENRTDELERAAGTQHETNAHENNTDSVGFRALRFSLPVTTDVGEESTPGWRRFVDQCFAGVTVEADGGSVDQDTRPLSHRLDGFHNSLRASDAAFPDLTSSSPPSINQVSVPPPGSRSHPDRSDREARPGGRAVRLLRDASKSSQFHAPPRDKAPPRAIL